MSRLLCLILCVGSAVGWAAEGQGSRRRVLLPAATGGEVSRVETGVFLGVMSLRVPEEVTAQLGLAAGFGLVVEAVLPGSPAEKAGLKRHDVLLTFGDQELVNPEQLLALVRRSKKGSEVVLSVMSQAERKEVRVVLEEGPVEMLSEAGKKGEAKAARVLVPVGALAASEEAEAGQGRVIRRDETGEYVLSHESDGMRFSAAPKDGGGGEWPVASDEQKRLVPERFQEKLQGLFEVLHSTAQGLPAVRP